MNSRRRFRVGLLLVKAVMVSFIIHLSSFTSFAAPPKTVSGAGFSGNSPYATDAYPGFDGLDEIEKPKKKDKSWFNWVDRATPAEQYEMAKQYEAEGSYRKARRACDALVREWPSSPEAPQAQLRLAMILAKQDKDYEEAFQELEYLLNFYSRDCPYLELIEYEYKLTNLMIKEQKTIFGFSFMSTRLVRQHYESIVRRAPGASYVPEAMLKIADLREQDSHYEEAVKVYAQLTTKFPLTKEARLAVYLQAKARMWLCRRLSYNVPRCRDTVNYFKMVFERYPDLEQTDELKGWQAELKTHLAEDAYVQAKFYDSRQRTRHAAAAAWEKYLQEYPDSPHAEEIRARIETLKNGAAK